MGQAKARFFPGVSQKNTEQVVASEIMNSPCLMLLRELTRLPWALLPTVLCSIDIIRFTQT